MEHPLIGNIDNLKDEELMQKISELTKKYFIAQRMGNQDLCNQISMALDTYKNKQQERLNKLRNPNGDTDHDDKIDIS